jgi:uncharacterized cupredoxin-like copper-binding protein
MPSRPAAVSIIAVVAMGATGCGSDDSSSSSSSQQSKATAQATVSNSASSDPQASGTATNVSMTEFKFAPEALSARPGRLPVRVKNNGSAPHEFVVIRTTKAADALPTKGAEASEAGAIGEIPEQQPGKTASHTFNLKAGKYVFICNVPGHYKSGMYGTLTVK